MSPWDCSLSSELGVRWITAALSISNRTAEADSWLEVWFTMRCRCSKWLWEYKQTCKSRTNLAFMHLSFRTNVYTVKSCRKSGAGSCHLPVLFIHFTFRSVMFTLGTCLLSQIVHARVKFALLLLQTDCLHSHASARFKSTVPQLGPRHPLHLHFPRALGGILLIHIHLLTFSDSGEKDRVKIYQPTQKKYMPSKHGCFKVHQALS